MGADTLHMQSWEETGQTKGTGFALSRRMKSAATPAPMAAKGSDYQGSDPRSAQSFKSSEEPNPTMRQDEVPNRVEALLRRHASLVHEIE